jgi:hypothetical protein
MFLRWWVTLFLALPALAQDLPSGVPRQSREAFHHAAREGARYAPLLYHDEGGGLACAQTSSRSAREALEAAANRLGVHPGYVAEMLAAHLWDDWSRLHVPGYDLRAVVSEDTASEHPERLEAFLEAFYQAHHACALGLMQALTGAYEGSYRRGPDGSYHLVGRAQGDPYELLALYPRYFPGTGILEPLGLVYAVRLAELMQLAVIRKPFLSVVAATLKRRAEEGGDPLKVAP